MTASGALFGRAWTLDIAPPKQTKATRFGNVGENSAPLRISFEIEKNSLGTSNKSKIVIYNLGPDLRNTIAKGHLLRLNAGYIANRDVLFTGNVFTVKNERSGSDLTTTLECGDGEGAITYSSLNKTYRGPVSLAQILQDCAMAMEASTDFSPTGIKPGAAVGLPNKSFRRFVAEGPVRRTLTKLLKPLGLEWNIQNGKLNIIPTGGHSGQQAEVVSPSTGLINLPSVDKSITKFTSLINPRLIPGHLVQLISPASNLTGFYKIRTSKFKGDTYDKDWQVECECAGISAAVKPQTIANSFNYAAATS